MMPQLSTIEARVLGCLIEKEMSTPEYYPLSLNALVAACNQKNNRDPVLALDEKTVEEATYSLRDKHLVWQVTQAGSRTPKYRHDLTAVVKVTPLEAAVLCELLVRGAQTTGELRARVPRLGAPGGPAEIDAAAASLAGWPEHPLAVKLPPGPGRREARLAHRLCGDPVPDAPVEAGAAAPPTPGGTTGADPAPVLTITNAMLLNEAQTLRAEIAALRADVADLRRQFT